MSILRYMLRRINASTSSLNKHRFGRENSRGASLLQKIAQQWENSRLDQAGCIRCWQIISALICAIILIATLLPHKVSKCTLTILLVISIIVLIITIIICLLRRNRQRRRTSQPGTSPDQNYQGNGSSSSQSDTTDHAQITNCDDEKLILKVPFSIYDCYGIATIYIFYPERFLSIEEKSEFAEHVLAVLDENPEVGLSSINLPSEDEEISECEEKQIVIDIIVEIAKQYSIYIEQKIEIYNIIDNNTYKTYEANIEYGEEYYKVNIEFECEEFKYE